jgi:hypothetical protein
MVQKWNPGQEGKRTKETGRLAVEAAGGCILHIRPIDLNDSPRRSAVRIETLDDRDRLEDHEGLRSGKSALIRRHADRPAPSGTPARILDLEKGGQRRHPDSHQMLPGHR